MLRSKIAVVLLSGALATMGFVPVSMAASADSAQSAKAAKPAAAKVSKARKERVVLQVSDADPKTWNQALNVIENLQQEFGKDKVNIELVAFGMGIGILKLDSVAGNRVQEAAQNGAQILACENTMRRQKLTKDDMQPNIAYVPGGVIEIIARQRQGWVALRP